jgi:hypothetical protein
LNQQGGRASRYVISGLNIVVVSGGGGDEGISVIAHDEPNVPGAKTFQIFDKCQGLRQSLGMGEIRAK